MTSRQNIAPDAQAHLEGSLPETGIPLTLVLSPKGERKMRAAAPRGDPLVAAIYEDDDLLVVNKPAGLVCHPTKGDAYSSLISRVRLYLGGGRNPQLINRLDRETSGVLFVGKNAPAALELRRLWESRSVRKEYLAIVHGRVEETHGVIDAALGRDERSPVAIKDCVRPDGAAAVTEFQVEERLVHEGREFSLLRVTPLTGRKHQIRIHLAHYGHPIVGDKLYPHGDQVYLAFVQRLLTEEQRRELLLPHQALHAWQVCFRWRERDWRFQGEPEGWFTGFLNVVGRKPACK